MPLLYILEILKILSKRKKNARQTCPDEGRCVGKAEGWLGKRGGGLRYGWYCFLLRTRSLFVVEVCGALLIGG